MKNVIKYILSLAIAGALLWYVFRDIDATALLAKLTQVRYGWVVGAAAILLLTYFIRAYRWNILLHPLGYRHLTVFRTAVAVAIGYFANLLVPRMGEVSRCGVLKRLEDVPLTTSLGTVVAERFIDLLSLLTVTVILFVAEFDRLSSFITGFATDKADNGRRESFRHLSVRRSRRAAVLPVFYRRTDLEGADQAKCFVPEDPGLCAGAGAGAYQRSPD